MKQINVFKRFALTLNSTPQWFEVGVQKVEAAVASHWHTLAHATVVDADAVVAPVVSAADAELAKAEADALKAKADAAAELKAAEARVAEEIKAADEKLAAVTKKVK
jgi:hypothetical protein